MKNYSLGFLILFILGLQACSYLPEETVPPTTVKVEERTDYISLTPSQVPVKESNILFYPGGLVDPLAYIPMFQGLVETGYRVLILKTPSNLAILNNTKASSYMDDYPRVKHWIIAGHSLGGAVAAINVAAEPDKYDGLVLMASYPPESADLSDWNGTVLSLFAENDGLASLEDIEASEALLPNASTVLTLADMPSTPTTFQTLFHQIEGGNHAQFGAYGEQKGDGEASISQEAQHQVIVDFIKAFFQANQWS